jgi:protein involved in polysaccharide export with SLBB domain
MIMFGKLLSLTRGQVLLLGCLAVGALQAADSPAVIPGPAAPAVHTPAAPSIAPELAAAPPASPGTTIVSGTNAASLLALAGDSSQTYRLTANDLIRVRVYMEDDLTTEMRLGKDGTTTFPLLGVVNLAGKTVEEAAASMRDALGKDYLVNPQITLTVIEYAKRRFTVLGQVQKPGSYELPGEESVTLLQAIAMAGGFTRLAVQSKVTVTRIAGGKRTMVVDVKSNANDPATRQFDIQPDDTIIVAERVF